MRTPFENEENENCDKLVVPDSVAASTRTVDKSENVPLVSNYTGCTNNVPHTVIVKNIGDGLCSVHNRVLESTPVQHHVEPFQSTGVDYMPVMKKQKYDSNTDDKLQVQFEVQNFFDMDENYKSYSEDNLDSSSECENTTL